MANFVQAPKQAMALQALSATEASAAEIAVVPVNSARG